MPEFFIENIKCDGQRIITYYIDMEVFMCGFNIFCKFSAV
jgi:hypothetical protein